MTTKKEQPKQWGSLPFYNTNASTPEEARALVEAKKREKRLKRNAIQVVETKIPRGVIIKYVQPV